MRPKPLVAVTRILLLVAAGLVSASAAFAWFGPRSVLRAGHSIEIYVTPSHGLSRFLAWTAPHPPSWLLATGVVGCWLLVIGSLARPRLAGLLALPWLAGWFALAGLDNPAAWPWRDQPLSFALFVPRPAYWLAFAAVLLAAAAAGAAALRRSSRPVVPA